MLVNLKRAANGQEMAVNPHSVAAAFEHNSRPDTVVIRLADGKGYLVNGSYNEIAEPLLAADNAEFVQLARVDRPSLLGAVFDEGTGEDEGFGEQPEPTPQPERLALIQPRHVAAIFESVRGTTIVRLPGGRGVDLKGSFEVVRNQIDPDRAHSQPSAAVDD